ncbi:MAG TPA: histidine phosphatase family protein [Solirubrobacteraceae bacterium]|nr:histidine phosphatase family protein [Solirubrobacteraceae bacterium]
MGDCILIRHAESAYNVAGLVNGDHALRVPLSARGVEQARALRSELAHLEIDACVHTRFLRTVQTARLVLPRARRPRFVCESLLDDIGCGDMEGWAVRDDHAWRAARPRDARPPDGESVAEAARRIARGLRAVAMLPERFVAVVAHELVLRYALNGAAGSADIARPWREVPNTRPFALDRAALVRAADRIDLSAASAWARALPDNAG